MSTDTDWTTGAVSLAAMAVCGLLLYAAGERARAHASLRQARLIRAVDAARQLFAGHLAAVATIGGL
jgi:hypothetical protein